MAVAFLDTRTVAQGASTPHQASFVPGTNQIDMRAYVSRADWAAIVNLGAFLAQWSSTVANCRFMLTPGSGGTLVAQWYNAAGVLQNAVSLTAVGFSPGQYKWVRAIINPGAGTVDFATSDDNVTYTALGAQITGKTTTAVQTTGTAPVLSVGLDSSGANGLPAKFLRSQLRVNNVLLVDIDWSTKAASPTGTWTGATGEVWTSVSSARINQEDAATSAALITSSSAAAFDAGTTVFQVTSYGTTPAAIASTFDPTLFQDCIAAGNARANRMMNAMPPYYANDPTVRGYVCAMAKELDRVEAQANATRSGAFPSQADLRTLAYYEKLFSLTIVGLTQAQRQSQVTAHFRQRQVAERFDWQQALLTFIGSTGWSYAESPSNPYTILLTTPVDPSGQRTPVITAFARAITPAHLQLIVNGSFGNFKVGISLIGIDPL